MKAKILVYVSSAKAVPLKEGGTHATGVFLGELTEPLEPLVSAGHELYFVSPDGGPPHIDKNSFRLMYWGWNRKRLDEARAFYEQLRKLGIENPRKLSSLSREEISGMDVLFIPGGHAPMTDILHRNWLEGNSLNEETGKLLLHFHKSNKPTALICHAPVALAAAPEQNGQWIYQGYRMCCVTMVSERLVEDVPGFKVMGGHIPDYPERILRRKGAELSLVKIPMISHVVEDRELITGQDPYSARALGKKLLDKINRYLQSVQGKMKSEKIPS